MSSGASPQRGGLGRCRMWQAEEGESQMLGGLAGPRSGCYLQGLTQKAGAHTEGGGPGARQGRVAVLITPGGQRWL